VERARLMGEVVETATVLRAWENFGLAIRRVILGSKLTDAEKDEILNELYSLRKEDFAEQQKADSAPLVEAAAQHDDEETNES
jgi:hypothetical protein